MEFSEALKLVQAKKSKENFLTVEINYDKKIIFPYKDGLLFMSSLANAEQFNNPYNKTPSIGPLDCTAIKTNILSALEYEQIKVAALLNVSLDEVKEHYKETV